MKKNRLYVLLYLLAALLTALFAAALYRDYTVFYPYGSAPFGVYVAERFAEFILPAAACLVAGIVFAKKQKKADYDEGDSHGD